MTAFLRRLEQDPYGEFDPEAYNTEPETAFVPVVPRRAEAYSANSPIGDFLAQIVPEPYMKAAGDAGNALSGFASGAVNTVGGLFGYGPDEDDMRNRYRSPEAAAAGIGAAVAPIIATPLPGEATAFKVVGNAVNAAARAPKTTALALSPVAASATGDGTAITTPYDAEISDLEARRKGLEAKRAELLSELKAIPEYTGITPTKDGSLPKGLKITDAQSALKISPDGQWGKGSRAAMVKAYEDMQKRAALQGQLKALGLSAIDSRIAELRPLQQRQVEDGMRRREAKEAADATGVDFGRIPGTSWATEDGEDYPLTVNPNMIMLGAGIGGLALGSKIGKSVMAGGREAAEKAAGSINEMGTRMGNKQYNPNFGRSMSTKKDTPILDNKYADIGARTENVAEADRAIQAVTGTRGAIGRAAAPTATMATVGGLYTATDQLKQKNKAEADKYLELYTSEQDPVKRKEYYKRYMIAESRARLADSLTYGEAALGLGAAKGMLSNMYPRPSTMFDGKALGNIAKERGATRQASDMLTRDITKRDVAERAAQPTLMQKLFGPAREPEQIAPPPNAGNAGPNPAPPQNNPLAPQGNAPNPQAGAAQGGKPAKRGGNYTNAVRSQVRSSLASMADNGVVSRAVVDDIADMVSQAGGKIPRKRLTQYLDNTRTYIKKRAEAGDTIDGNFVRNMPKVDPDTNRPLLSAAGVAGGTAAAVMATPDDATAANAPGSDLATQRKQVRNAFEQVIAEEGGIPDELRDVRGARDFNQRLRDMGYNVGFSEDRHFEVLSKLDGFMAENGRIPTADEWPMIWGDPAKTSTKRAVDQPRGPDGKFVKLSSREKRQWQKRLQNMQPEE
jgi:hypothetical protein